MTRLDVQFQGTVVGLQVYSYHVNKCASVVWGGIEGAGRVESQASSLNQSRARMER